MSLFSHLCVSLNLTCVFFWVSDRSSQISSSFGSMPTAWLQERTSGIWWSVCTMEPFPVLTLSSPSTTSAANPGWCVFRFIPTRAHQTPLISRSWHFWSWTEQMMLHKLRPNRASGRQNMIRVDMCDKLWDVLCLLYVTVLTHDQDLSDSGPREVSSEWTDLLPQPHADGECLAFTHALLMTSPYCQQYASHHAPLVPLLSNNSNHNELFSRCLL